MAALLYCCRIISCTLVTLTLSTPVVRAGIVFSNLALDCGHCGDAIEGRNNGPPFSLAAAFTPAGDYSLTGARARFLGLLDSTVDFSIHSSSNNVPGLLLAALGSATILENTSGLFSASGPIPSLLLSSGVEYWLVLTPGTADTLVGWQDHGSSFQQFAATTDATGLSHWSAVSPQSVQFEIDGTPASSAVPEPGNVWLLIPAIGSAGLMLARRVRPTNRSLAWGRLIRNGGTDSGAPC